jgi:hypothetical protein
MEKGRMDVHDIPLKAIILARHHLVRLKLIYHQQIPITNIPDFTIDQKGISAAQAKKKLTAFVNMHIRILVFAIRVKYAKALGFHRVLNRIGTAVKKTSHFFTPKNSDTALILTQDDYKCNN